MRGTGTGAETGTGTGTGPRSWTGLTHGRRGAVAAASAAVVALGGVLASCGGGGGDGGHVAVAAPVVSPTGLRPSAPVTLVPLDGSPEADANSPAAVPTSPPQPGRRTADARGAGDGSADGGGPAPDASPSTPTGAESTRTTTEPPAPTAPPADGATSSSPAPAALTWGDPAREATEQRWCEKVTVTFHNTGGTVVRSGKVTFGTHIIGALGIDWATVESTRDLPAPLRPGADDDHTWTVCVEAWRVPLGMHIETRDVSVTWK
ncbi:hypothetical protein ABZ922_40380 [Streptomyces shenzhenensis]|uniref:hypothetical protein n=1 Tax=Streptomyces shenzhenensis TaxID=943815 RepID=UPI0033E8DF1F